HSGGCRKDHGPEQERHSLGFLFLAASRGNHSLACRLRRQASSGVAKMSERLGTELPVAKSTAGGDERVRRMPLLAQALRRPELGALSGVILIYVIFFALAHSSGMFGVEGLINILSVSAEIGILAAAATLLMIAGEFDLSIGSMIGFAGIVIGL